MCTERNARSKRRLCSWPVLIWAAACGHVRTEAEPSPPVVDGRCMEADSSPGVATGPRSYFLDRDEDGFGVGERIGETCEPVAPPGTTFVASDCNDEDPIHWGLGPLYRDSDGDGVGYSDDNSLEGCVFPTSGYSREVGDCDDTDPTTVEWSFQDLDGDGWGNQALCAPVRNPESDILHVVLSGDCNDADRSINPKAADVAGDLIDADCDGWGFPTEQEACELHSAASDEPAQRGESSIWQCVPIEVTLPHELRPECESLPDPIIVATRRVEQSPNGVMYDVKVGNTGGMRASVVVRQTDEDGHAVDSAQVQLAPLGTSEWLEISLATNTNGPNHTRVELLNADGTADCSPVDSSAEFVLYHPRNVH